MDNPPYNKNVPSSRIFCFNNGNVNPTIASQNKLLIVEQLTLLSGANSGIISHTIGPNPIPKQKLSNKNFLNSVNELYTCSDKIFHCPCYSPKPQSS